MIRSYDDFVETILNSGFSMGGGTVLKYSVTIKYANRDNIYVANIPELQGCIAHGGTPEDAIKEHSLIT